MDKFTVFLCLVLACTSRHLRDHHELSADHQKKQQTPFPPPQRYVKGLVTVDMTHTFHPGDPTWPGVVGLKTTLSEAKTDAYHYRSYSLEMLQNIGTHLDSPSHFIEDGLRASQLNINDLVNLPLCIIDIRGKPNVVDYELSLDDVKAYEQRHGRIPKRSLVVANSGWQNKWSDQAQYRNYNEKDQLMHFPLWSLEAVKFLDQERQISGIGCDTLSPETAAPFPIHVYILGRGKFIVENINNVDKMPPAGGLVSVNIIKFADITEAPARVVGFYVA